MHIELKSDPGNFACWTGYTVGQQILEGAGIGRIGLTSANGTRQECSNLPDVPVRRIAVLHPNGNLEVKEGGLDAGWVTINGAVSAFQLDGARIAVLHPNGNLEVKEGGLDAGWVTINGAVSGYQLGAKVRKIAPPNGPTAVTAAAGDRQATVTWSAAQADGSLPIIGYQVEASPGGASCATIEQLSCSVLGLSNGTSYTFTVRAVNAMGFGPMSGPSVAVAPTGAGRIAAPPAPGVAGAVGRVAAPSAPGVNAAVGRVNAPSVSAAVRMALVSAGSPRQ